MRLKFEFTFIYFIWFLLCQKILQCKCSRRLFDLDNDPDEDLEREIPKNPVPLVMSSLPKVDSSTVISKAVTVKQSVVTTKKFGRQIFKNLCSKLKSAIVPKPLQNPIAAATSANNLRGDDYPEERLSEDNENDRDDSGEIVKGQRSDEDTDDSSDLVERAITEDQLKKLLEKNKKVIKATENKDLANDIGDANIDLLRKLFEKSLEVTPQSATNKKLNASELSEGKLDSNLVKKFLEKGQRGDDDDDSDLRERDIADNEIKKILDKSQGVDDYEDDEVQKPDKSALIAKLGKVQRSYDDSDKMSGTGEGSPMDSAIANWLGNGGIKVQRSPLFKRKWFKFGNRDQREARSSRDIEERDVETESDDSEAANARDCEQQDDCQPDIEDDSFDKTVKKSKASRSERTADNILPAKNPVPVSGVGGQIPINSIQTHGVKRRATRRKEREQLKELKKWIDEMERYFDYIPDDGREHTLEELEKVYRQTKNNKMPREDVPPPAAPGVAEGEKSSPNKALNFAFAVGGLLIIVGIIMASVYMFVIKPSNKENKKKGGAYKKVASQYSI